VTARGGRAYSVRVVLLRHGETAPNAEGRLVSRTDVPLTTRGRAEAQQAGGTVRRLCGGGTFEVWVSPSRRARETAELVLPSTRAEVQRDLREADFGDYEGMETAEIQKAVPGWTYWRDGCPNGEPVEAVVARASRVTAALSRLDNPVLVVSHGVFLRTLLCILIGVPPAYGDAFVIDPGGIAVTVNDEMGIGRLHALMTRISSRE